MLTRAAVDTLTEALLAHLSDNPELVGTLAGESGLMPGDLRRLAAESPLALGTALLDFICREDDRLLAFSAASGWPAQTVEQARQALEGGYIR